MDSGGVSGRSLDAFFWTLTMVMVTALGSPSKWPRVSPYESFAAASFRPTQKQHLVDRDSCAGRLVKIKSDGLPKIRAVCVGGGQADQLHGRLLQQAYTGPGQWGVFGHSRSRSQ